jgi:hypothetical protein
MLTKLCGIRLRPHPCSVDHILRDSGTTSLTALIQALKVAEKATDILHVPNLKGAIGLSLIIAESIRVRGPCFNFTSTAPYEQQGNDANSESLRKLALKCSALVVRITEKLEQSANISGNLEALVADLFK